MNYKPYLLFLLYIPLEILELIAIISPFMGDEYPENVIGTFILFLLTFVIFIVLTKYLGKITKLSEPIIVVNAVMLSSGLTYELYKGQGYFFENWKG